MLLGRVGRVNERYTTLEEADFYPWLLVAILVKPLGVSTGIDQQHYYLVLATLNVGLLDKLGYPGVRGVTEGACAPLCFQGIRVALLPRDRARVKVEFELGIQRVVDSLGGSPLIRVALLGSVNHGIPR